MKKVYTRKRNKGEEEPAWITAEIKEGIKRRRKVNRERRNETDPINRERLWHQYLNIKAEVQRMVRERIEEHEWRLTEEIKRNRSKMWENIKKLRAQEKKEPKIYRD